MNNFVFAQSPGLTISMAILITIFSLAFLLFVIALIRLTTSTMTTPTRSREDEHAPAERRITTSDDESGEDDYAPGEGKITSDDETKELLRSIGISPDKQH